MTDKDSERPYKAIGDRLKFLREQWQQSIKEVSNTLEIDEDTLKSIENGKVLPEIETLDMFINHFLLTEEQADDLRQLVDSTLGKSTDLNGLNIGFEDMLAKQVVMYMPVDNKVVYTDAMNANVNDHGVILQFMQQMPGSKQPAIVSRVGMSREHAEKVIKVLRSTLEQYDTNRAKKSLPSPDNKKDKK